MKIFDAFSILSNDFSYATIHKVGDSFFVASSYPLSNQRTKVVINLSINPEPLIGDLSSPKTLPTFPSLISLALLQEPRNYKVTFSSIPDISFPLPNFPDFNPQIESPTFFSLLFDYFINHFPTFLAIDPTLNPPQLILFEFSPELCHINYQAIPIKLLDPNFSPCIIELPFEVISMLNKIDQIYPSQVAISFDDNSATCTIKTENTTINFPYFISPSYSSKPISSFLNEFLSPNSLHLAPPLHIIRPFPFDKFFSPTNFEFHKDKTIISNNQITITFPNETNRSYSTVSTTSPTYLRRTIRETFYPKIHSPFSNFSVLFSSLPIVTFSESPLKMSFKSIEGLSKRRKKESTWVIFFGEYKETVLCSGYELLSKF